MTPYLMVTFHTTAAAMEAEKLCKQKNIPGRLTPVPRSLTSSCGIGWRCEPGYREKLEELFQNNPIEVEMIHIIA